MGTWSTTAPSNVTWGSRSLVSNVIKPTAYQFRTESHIGRGQNNTIYVRVTMQAQCYDASKSPATIGLKAQVSVGNTSSYSSSSTYTKSVGYGLGTWTTIATVYYTDTAAPGTKVYARSYATSAYITSANEHTTPGYTTKYKITYNANGGTGTTPQSEFLYNGSATIESCGFTKTGHNFSGWNTKADGTGTSYAPGATYSTNANLTLYAQWSQMFFALSYNGNGPGGATVTNLPPNRTWNYGEPLVVSNMIPVCGDYSFRYWCDKADGTGEVFLPGNSYSRNKSVTLFAIWADTYPVTYDGNGATDGSTESQTKVKDIALSLSDNGFIREKYSFVGWCEDPAGLDSPILEPGDEYTENAALALYAIWQKNNIPVFYKDGQGAVHQVEKAYYKDSNGVVHECTMYYKDSNGTVHEIA